MIALIRAQLASASWMIDTVCGDVDVAVEVESLIDRLLTE